jgi:hypothetical protein
LSVNAIVEPPGHRLLMIAVASAQWVASKVGSEKMIEFIVARGNGLCGSRVIRAASNTGTIS